MADDAKTGPQSHLHRRVFTAPDSSIPGVYVNHSHVHTQTPSTPVIAKSIDCQLYKTVLAARVHTPQEFSSTRVLTTDCLSPLSDITGYQQLSPDSAFIESVSDLSNLSNGVLLMGYTLALSFRRSSKNYKPAVVVNAMIDRMVLLTCLAFWRLNRRVYVSRGSGPNCAGTPDHLIHTAHKHEELSWILPATKTVTAAGRDVKHPASEVDTAFAKQFGAACASINTPSARAVFLRESIAKSAIQSLSSAAAEYKIQPMGPFFRRYLFALLGDAWLKMPEIFEHPEVSKSKPDDPLDVKILAKVKEASVGFSSSQYKVFLPAHGFTIHEWNESTLRASGIVPSDDPESKWKYTKRSWFGLDRIEYKTLERSVKGRGDIQAAPRLISHVHLYRLMSFFSERHSMQAMSGRINECLRFVPVSKPNGAVTDYILKPSVLDEKGRSSNGGGDNGSSSAATTTTTALDNQQIETADILRAWRLYSQTLLHTPKEPGRTSEHAAEARKKRKAAKTAARNKIHSHDSEPDHTDAARKRRKLNDGQHGNVDNSSSSSDDDNGSGDGKQNVKQTEDENVLLYDGFPRDSDSTTLANRRLTTMYKICTQTSHYSMLHRRLCEWMIALTSSRRQARLDVFETMFKLCLWYSCQWLVSCPPRESIQFSQTVLTHPTPLNRKKLSPSRRAAAREWDRSIRANLQNTITLTELTNSSALMIPMRESVSCTVSPVVVSRFPIDDSSSSSVCEFLFTPGTTDWYEYSAIDVGLELKSIETPHNNPATFWGQPRFGFREPDPGLLLRQMESSTLRDFTRLGAKSTRRILSRQLLYKMSQMCPDRLKCFPVYKELQDGPVPGFRVLTNWKPSLSTCVVYVRDDQPSPVFSELELALLDRQFHMPFIGYGHITETLIVLRMIFKRIDDVHYFFWAGGTNSTQKQHLSFSDHFVKVERARDKTRRAAYDAMKKSDFIRDELDIVRLWLRNLDAELPFSSIATKCKMAKTVALYRRRQASPSVAKNAFPNRNAVTNFEETEWMAFCVNVSLYRLTSKASTQFTFDDEWKPRSLCDQTLARLQEIQQHALGQLNNSSLWTSLTTLTRPSQSVNRCLDVLDTLKGLVVQIPNLETARRYAHRLSSGVLPSDLQLDSICRREVELRLNKLKNNNNTAAAPGITEQSFKLICQQVAADKLSNDASQVNFYVPTLIHDIVLTGTDESSINIRQLLHENNVRITPQLPLERFI